MKLKIIKFKDGKFGIRRGMFRNFQYLDISSNGRFWWPLEYFAIYGVDCRTDEETARSIFDALTDKGEVVK